MYLENYIDDDLQLKLENPIQYYLNHIDNEEIMIELIRDDHYLFQHVKRIDFINKIRNQDKIYQCPECRGNIITDEWGEEYCECCGLVTRTHYPYVAGQRFLLDYGLK